MIHPTSPFVFFGSPSPFRHAMPHSSSYVPTYLACPSVASHRLARTHEYSQILTISLRAIHDRFACRLVFSRHVFRSLPSIPRVLSFAHGALGDPSSLKLSSAGRWAPKDFIAALLAPRNVHGDMCPRARYRRENDAFYFKLATPVHVTFFLYTLT